MTIKQHSESWLDAKRTRVGASEIAGLVHYYCKEELKALNIEFEPYNTALQTWAKVKFGVELPFPKSISRWGLGMEEYIAGRFHREQEQIACVQTDDFVIKSDLMACSPDGYVRTLGNIKVPDFDKQVAIDNSWGKGTLEMKTTSFLMKDDFRDGFKWHYIFQMQYQMLCCDTNWGVGAVLIPKEFWEDEGFERGVILGRIESGNYSQQEIDDLFFLEHFVYAKKPQLIKLIDIALEKFKHHLANNIVPNVYDGTKKQILANEKQVLALLHPVRFGELEANEELDGLLIEMQILQVEKKKLEVEESATKNRLTKEMGDHIAIIGTQYKAKFDSRMALRFSKN
tara:strand:+ start:1866 stop:2891 length:1026 start_codon:yes stop_codon:yes gene_type:complete